MRPDEESLIARAQRGDTGAFETLYHANANRLFTLCLRMTGDRAQAKMNIIAAELDR